MIGILAVSEALWGSLGSNSAILAEEGAWWADDPMVEPGATDDPTASAQEQVREVLARARAEAEAQRGSPGLFDDLLPAEPLPPAVRQAPGIMWNRTGRAPVAPFEIITQPGADYFIKLVEPSSDRDAVAIFVHGGQRLEVEVPLGRYVMRYAAGETWRGEAALFGPGETALEEAEPVFVFEQDSSGISGYTVELILQAAGNMQTHPISLDQF